MTAPNAPMPTEGEIARRLPVEVPFLTAIDRERRWPAQETAQFCGFHVRTLWRLLAGQQFPEPIRLSKKLVLWRAGDVIDWLNGQKKGGGQ